MWILRIRIRNTDFYIIENWTLDGQRNEIFYRFLFARFKSPSDLVRILVRNITERDIIDPGKI